jgi:hypothetical protein
MFRAYGSCFNYYPPQPLQGGECLCGETTIIEITKLTFYPKFCFVQLAIPLLGGVRGGWFGLMFLGLKSEVTKCS